jgi:hypothetical protein
VSLSPRALHDLVAFYRMLWRQLTLARHSSCCIKNQIRGHAQTGYSTSRHSRRDHSVVTINSNGDG